MNRSLCFPSRYLLLLLCCCVATATAGERTPIPTPPGGGEGVSLGVEDMKFPVSGVFECDLDANRRLPDQFPSLVQLLGEQKGLDDIGGDDVRVTQHDNHLHDCSMDIDSNGDIYIAVEYYDATTNWGIWIFRSQDGGDTWDDWGEIEDAGFHVEYQSPSLHVAEGNSDRCFVAFSKTDLGVTTVCVAGSDLALATGDFSTEVVVMDNASWEYFHPCLTSDATSYSDYYLYLVAWGYESDGGDICFARSITFGVSFEAEYLIASIVGTDRDYQNPWVSYGYGGFVHVGWQFSSRDGGFDSATRYRRADNFANGGLGAWGAIQYLTGSGDEVWDDDHYIAASLSTNQVLIGFSRRINGGAAVTNPGILASANAGTTFTEVTIPGGLWFVDGLEQQPSTLDWILTGGRPHKGVQRASADDVTTWGPVEILADTDYWSGYAHEDGLALDPTHSDRIAFAWTHGEYTTDDSLMFDAEWRADPGYPNLEDGFPLDLPAQPISPPALVDLGGDSDLEIVFSDVAGNIQVIQADGTNLPGWPVNVGVPLADGPVAVGNLDGNQLYVVAGTADDHVYAYLADGTLADGWPYDIGLTESAYVSIGALGGPFPRTVVVCAGNRLRWVSHHGITPPGATGWNTGATYPAGPAAIGDIDGDGVSEAVVGFNTAVFAFNMQTTTVILSHAMGVEISDALTLGDFDLNGDVEIVVPTMVGDLYLLEGDGAAFPGTWPFSSSTGSQLTSGAIADCLGNDEPEIAVAAKEYTVHMVYHHGGQHSGYPVENNGWYIYPAPIMGRVDDTASDVVIGTRGYRGWAWRNSGGLISGWPKLLENHIYESPAMGDIDNDGSSEIVFLTLDQLVIVDVNNTPHADYKTWPMYGHDPQRTGCSDCPEDVTTAVPGDDSGVTRVSFAPPSPNPATNSAVFSFAVPVRAQVLLELYDLRGYRIRSIHKQEMAAGKHLVTWDGRDQSGKRLSSGHYLARLQVRGPGLDQRLTRKITILR